MDDTRAPLRAGDGPSSSAGTMLTTKLSPEAAALALRPYLLQGRSPAPHMEVYRSHVLTPAQRAFYRRAGADRFAVLDRIEQEGLLLEVVYAVSVSGRRFIADNEYSDPFWRGHFRLLVYGSEEEAQAFVERRAQPIAADYALQLIDAGPPLGDAEQWFRCDTPAGLPPFTFRPQTAEYGDQPEYGDHVRWQRGLLALELRVGQRPEIHLPGFIALAQQLDSLHALKPRLKLGAEIPAGATERERLTTLLRLGRLRSDPHLVQFGGPVPEKYTWFNAFTPAERVLLAVDPAEHELDRLAVGWQRVAAFRLTYAGPYRINLTADAIVDGSVEAARRDLHAPPLERLWDTLQLLPNAVSLGEETVTRRTTQQQPNGLESREESIAWTHGPVKLIASASGSSHRTDWSVLPRFAEALEAAYQHSVVCEAGEA
jgi:hypothetical protein